MNSAPPTSTNKQLVLLSGLLCDERVWQPVAQHLDTDLDVKIFSFAGFHRFSDMAKHVLANISGSFALAGHSMGGRVALEVFHQAPQRITHLSLLNTGVHPVSESERPGRQRLLDLASNQGMPAVADVWLPPMVGALARQNPELMANLRAMVLKHSVEDFTGMISALLNRPDPREDLQQLSVPTLLICSDEDQWSPTSQHQAIQSKIEGSKLHELHNIGHMSTVEAPREIAELFQQHWL